MTLNENDVSNPVSQQELLIGEITAALAAESMSAQDALPPAMAAQVIAARATNASATNASATNVSATNVSAANAIDVVVPRKPSTTPYNTGVLPPPPTASAPAVNARRPFATWGGWLAAAAMLALWLRGTSVPTAAVVSASVEPTAASASAAASWVRDSLIAVDSAVTRIAWAPTADSTAAGASGDVVWSTSAQRGVMRLIGLKSNDVRRWQYQLWIFDKTRDQRYPVDGGVFDVPAGATEVFVPINARVPVGSAVMFAVTVEAPGGVVVSTRERVALLAAL